MVEVRFLSCCMIGQLKIPRFSMVSHSCLEIPAKVVEKPQTCGFSHGLSPCPSIVLIPFPLIIRHCRLRNPLDTYFSLTFQGNLTELLHFWCCQIQKLWKSCRISSFWSCQLPLFEEVSQNLCVLDLSTSTFEGTLAELLPFRKKERANKKKKYRYIDHYR